MIILENIYYNINQDIIFIIINYVKYIGHVDSTNFKLEILCCKNHVYKKKIFIYSHISFLYLFFFQKPFTVLIFIFTLT